MITKFEPIIRGIFENYPQLDRNNLRSCKNMDDFPYSPEDIFNENITDIFIISYWISHKGGNHTTTRHVDNDELLDIVGDPTVSTKRKSLLYQDIMDYHVETIMIRYADDGVDIFIKTHRPELYLVQNGYYPEHTPAREDDDVEYCLDVSIEDTEEMNYYNRGYWIYTSSKSMILMWLDWVYTNHYEMGFHTYWNTSTLKKKLKDEFNYEFNH